MRKDETTLIVPFDNPVSLNKFYASRTHYFRSSQKVIWRKRFGEYVSSHYKELLGAKFENVVATLEVHHNRMDIDNQVMTAKFLMDTLEKDLQVIESDGPKHYTKLTMMRNEDLEVGTGLITVELWNEDK